MRVPVSVSAESQIETTTKAAENSEVLPVAFVAVAVMNLPAGTATGNTMLKLALQEPSVAMVTTSRYVWPSPKPEGSATSFEKSSISNVWLALLLRVPSIVVVEPSVSALVSTGKFCRKFEPETSASHASLGVGPSMVPNGGGDQLIPRPSFRKIELRRIAFSW